MIITRRYIISIVDDYLDSSQTLDGLNKIATDLLELDDAPEVDTKEPNVINRFLLFLEQLDEPRDFEIGKIDLYFYRNILNEIKNPILAISFLDLLKHRLEIVEIAKSFLKNHELSSFKNSIKLLNLSPVIERLFLDGGDRNDKLNGVLDDLQNGQLKNIHNLIHQLNKSDLTGTFTRGKNIEFSIKKTTGDHVVLNIDFRSERESVNKNIRLSFDELDTMIKSIHLSLKEKESAKFGPQKGTFTIGLDYEKDISVYDMVVWYRESSTTIRGYSLYLDKRQLTVLLQKLQKKS